MTIVFFFVSAAVITGRLTFATGAFKRVIINSKSCLIRTVINGTNIIIVLKIEFGCKRRDFSYGLIEVFVEGDVYKNWEKSLKRSQT